MQLRQGNALGTFATAPDAAGTDPCILAAHRAESIALLAGAIAALERRHAAGTLLGGKCAATEEAWRLRKIQRAKANIPAAEAANRAALVGYEQFMHSATNALDVISSAGRFGAECSDVQLLSYARHAAHAAELMQQPRRYDDFPLDMEAEFTDVLRGIVATARANGVDALPFVQPLARAWQQLQRSGVLQKRRIEEGIAVLRHEHRASRAAVQSSLTAPGLRSCALDGCDAKEAHPAHFKSCAACRAVVYCCQEHQVAGWPGHKKECKAARKAAAAAEEDGAGPSGA